MGQRDPVGVGVTTLAPDRSFLLPARLDHDAPANVAMSVEQRLARTEGELRIQFTRIAQLQAELDVLQATLRRALKNGAHPR